ncbi:MAG: DUF4405 domain-containing protein [Notoacmeibacter sp.]|nr:DUF4405 domain-containing protein [Notoacmeibacter sp.]
MPAFLSRYATPLITGLFVVSLVSGVALFFHIGTTAFRGMHEWLSLVLIAPFALHVWKNWRPFAGYFKRPPMMIALGISLATAVAFAVPAMTGAGGTSPQRAIFQAFENGAVADLAPLFGHDGASLAAALKAQGLTVESPSQKVRDIADASGRSPFEVVGLIAAEKR